jgi:TonB family protein
MKFQENPMNPAVKPKKLNPFQKSLLLSLICHTILTALIFLAPKDLFESNNKQIVQIDFVSSEKKPAQDLPKNDPKLEKKQVVDQDEKPINDEKTESKFLSAHDQVVKKQTVATQRGDFKNSRNKNSKSGDGGEKFKPMTFEDFKPKFDIKKVVEQKVAQEQLLEKLSDEAAIKKYDRKMATQNQPVSANKPGNTGAEASQTIDYIKDLDPGLETLLSTKEFVYYTYYARIRRQLNQHWGPKVREKITNLYKQGRTIASNEDKVTKLLITLDQAGKLLKAQIIGDSGVHDLDEAAIEAFRAAAPFPNPPHGIVDSDGVIKIRWDFILEA